MLYIFIIVQKETVPKSNVYKDKVLSLVLSGQKRYDIFRIVIAVI